MLLSPIPAMNSIQSQPKVQSSRGGIIKQRNNSYNSYNSNNSNNSHKLVVNNFVILCTFEIGPSAHKMESPHSFTGSIKLDFLGWGGIIKQRNNSYNSNKSYNSYNSHKLVVNNFVILCTFEIGPSAHKMESPHSFTGSIKLDFFRMGWGGEANTSLQYSHGCDCGYGQLFDGFTLVGEDTDHVQ